MEDNKEKFALDVILSIFIGSAICYALANIGGGTDEINALMIWFVVMLLIFVLARVTRRLRKIEDMLYSVLKTEQKDGLPDEQTENEAQN